MICRTHRVIDVRQQPRAQELDAVGQHGRELQTDHNPSPIKMVRRRAATDARRSRRQVENDGR